MATKATKSMAAGVILIAVGAILLVTRIAPVQSAPAWLLGLGLAFGLLGVFQRTYAALVAGMVLLGVGAGMVLGDLGLAGLTLRAWRLIALGVGFVGIYLLALLLRLNRAWWPLVPGLVLVAVGLAPFLQRLVFVPPEVEALIRSWWPLLLVAVGLVVLARALRR